MTDAPPPSGRTGYFPALAREIRMITRSPFHIMFVFILPLASFALLTVIFTEEVPRDLPVVVIDNDNSALSRTLTRMLDASPTLAVARFAADMGEGERIIREGLAHALLVIPGGFERDTLRGGAPQMTAFYNNQALLISGLIGRAARDATLSLAAAADVRARMARGQAPAEALEKSEPVRVEPRPLHNPNLNFRYFLLPALLPTMLHIFLIIVVVRSVGMELRRGTAGEWLRVSGGSPLLALLAKMTPHVACFLVMVNFMLAYLVKYCGVPFNGRMDVWMLAGLLFVLAYVSMSTLIVALTGSLRVAFSMAGFYCGPAFAFAGVTFPLSGMPPGALVWSYALPLTHYLRVMMEQVLQGAAPQSSLTPLAALAAFAFIPPFIIVPKLGRLMRDPGAWGRL